ncbi:HlyD family secretion protein [Aliivibrio fischeri]|uniref:HlyD family secretion protein n=1 Tax=Aliivibrio fischeri TaxID=668 RepID=UPI0037355A51
MTELKKKKNKAPLIATVIFILCGALGAGYWYGYGQYFQSTDNAYLQGDITTISSKVGGYIQQTLVEDNQKVKAGDLLATIDDRDFLAEKEKAEANVAVNAAAITNLNAERKLQDIRIRQSASQIESAQADLERAQQQVKRTKALIKKNYSSQDELDNNVSHLKVAIANLDAAKANYQASKEQINVIESQIGQANAMLNQAKTALDQANLNLSYTKIYAPIDGIVGKRSLREGLLVQAGMPLLSLVPTKEVWVEANFKETQLEKIHHGQKVFVDLDAYPDLHLKGIVESFSPATGAKFALLPPENATGNFTKIVQRVPVKISILNTDLLDGKLIPGLSVVATVDTRG